MTNKGKSIFYIKLENKWRENKFLCVGLDSDYDKIPDEFKKNGRSIGQVIFEFNRYIVDETAANASAFKPNAAFYEFYEKDGGIQALRDTIGYIHEEHPGIPVIYDAKRADIGNTNNGYVKSAFDDLQADAITVSPYLGKEALKPFLERTDKGIIVLARTSNPGAGELQDIMGENGEPFYLTVARSISETWNDYGNVAIVVGATYPDEMKKIREATGNIPFLIPGIGAQGGTVEEIVPLAMDSNRQGMIINSSRDIIFAEEPGLAAQETNDSINLARAA